MPTWLFLGLYLSIGLQLFGQYALTEAGPQLTGGIVLPVGSENVQLGPSLGLGGFFTHYRCGKRDGVWLEFQARYFQVADTDADTATLATPVPLLPPAEDPYGFLQLEGGVYYKVRLQNYHRPQELAFLVGPKISYRLSSQRGGDSFESDAYRSVKKGYLGLHVSALYRLPAGKRYSVLLGAGADYFLGDAVSTDLAPRLRYLNLFVRAGYVLWNTR